MHLGEGSGVMADPSHLGQARCLDPFIPWLLAPAEKKGGKGERAWLAAGGQVKSSTVYVEGQLCSYMLACQAPTETAPTKSTRRWLQSSEAVFTSWHPLDQPAYYRSFLVFHLESKRLELILPAAQGGSRVGQGDRGRSSSPSYQQTS